MKILLRSITQEPLGLNFDVIFEHLGQFTVRYIYFSFHEVVDNHDNLETEYKKCSFGGKRCSMAPLNSSVDDIYTSGNVKNLVS